MEKIRRALKLLRMCWQVLKLDRELIVFPILSALSAGAVIAIFVVPFVLHDEAFNKFASIVGLSGGLADYALTFLLYFLLYFVFIFFNAALIACAKIRFAGGDPTVADGINASLSRLPQIFVWALVTSVVGFLLNQFAKKKEGLASIIVGLIGAGWAIATYFAVPVLVSEKVGPIDAIKRSVAVLKKTWGEALVSEVGFSALSFIAAIPAIIMFFVGSITLETQQAVGFLLIGAAGLWFVTMSLVLSTLGSILKAGLYHYATEGGVPDQFDADVVKNAFHE